MWYLHRRGIPFVFWGEVPGFHKRGPLGSFVRRRLQAPLAKASAIAAIGSRASDAYRELFPSKPIYNIPYFCDLAPFVAARKSAQQRSGETVDILFSGQLINRKGPDVLLAAFNQVCQTDTRLRLLLLGSGPDRASLEAIVPPELSDRVIFLGHRPPDALPAIFAQADAFCLPSRHDGWGVVINEALGAGLPVLVSDAVGAGHDLIQDGYNGRIVPAEDSDALAMALREISDDATREIMANHAKEIAQRWEINEGVRRWRNASHEILLASRQSKGASK